MRRGLLNAYLFHSLAEVRIMAEEWQKYYNMERPHKALVYPSPVLYAEKYTQSRLIAQQLYPQAGPENLSKIEGTPFVDKVIEKLEISNQ